MAQAGWALIHSPAPRPPLTYVNSRRSDPLSGTARTRRLRIAATGVETERSPIARPLRTHLLTAGDWRLAACTACRGWHGRSSRQPSKSLTSLIRLNDCDGKRTHGERDDAPL